MKQNLLNPRKIFSILAFSAGFSSLAALDSSKIPEFIAF
jgi:hypothetical protein